MFRKITLTAAAALLVAACGSNAATAGPTPLIVYVTPEPTPVVTPSPTPAPTPVPTPTPAPIYLPDVVGDKVRFTSEGGDCAVDVTVTKVVKWASDNMFIKPASGNRFLTVEAVIAGVTGTCEDTNKGYLAFTLGDNDGFTYDSEPAWRDPQLPYDSDMSLKPDRKYKGWITFEVPKTLLAGSVFFGDGEWLFKL